MPTVNISVLTGKQFVLLAVDSNQDLPSDNWVPGSNRKTHKSIFFTDRGVKTSLTICGPVLALSFRAHVEKPTPKKWTELPA